MTRLLFLCLGLLLLLVSCTLAGNNPVASTQTPVPEVGEQPTATLPLAPDATEPPAETILGEDTVLTACPLEAQQSAFRDDLTFDLETLEMDLCYELDFTLSTDGTRFDARALVTMQNGSEDDWPDLLFRLYPHAAVLFGGTIEVKQVLVNGEAVTSERVLEDETGLLVPLAAPLAAGEGAVVDILFSGELATEAERQERVYGIFARSENAATLASWFPMLAVWNEADNRWFDVPVLGEGDAVFAESALIRARLTGPERFDLATSGLIVGTEGGEGTITHEVVTGPARDLTMVWMEGYEQREDTIDGTLIRNWYRPDHEDSAARVFQSAREALALFNERFGPYPFEEVEIVEVPLHGAGGVEYPQLFLMAQELYGPRGDQQFLTFATAHEMAHQWWYSMIGNNINAAPWQDEALTNWSALLWLEEAGSEEAAERVAQGFERSVEQFEGGEGEEEISAPLESFRGRSGAYATIVYFKGALFFAALREEIGEEAFFAALRDYYADHRFAIAQPDDLLGRFEESSGRSLDEFYKEWGVE
ncbi:MAG: M1 family metallopeptidase [Ardenticatenales bacterium]|nr:M1 family metallopeptidase [Ardenticatenales bacterium]